MHEDTARALSLLREAYFLGTGVGFTHAAPDRRFEKADYEEIRQRWENQIKPILLKKLLENQE